MPRYAVRKNRAYLPKLYETRDRDEAATQFVRDEHHHLSEEKLAFQVKHQGNGYYDVIYTRYYDVLETPITTRRMFRVYTPPDQSERGIAERAAHLALVHHLRILGYSGTLITEMLMETHDEDRRADAGFIPDDQDGETIGFEIKTRRDSLSRFKEQQRQYHHFFDRNILIITPDKTSSASELASLEWGIWEWNEGLYTVRKAQKKDGSCTKGQLLLGQLSSAELLQFSHKGIKHYSKLRLYQKREALLEQHGEAYCIALALSLLSQRSKSGRVQLYRINPNQLT